MRQRMGVWLVLVLTVLVLSGLALFSRPSYADDLVKFKPRLDQVEEPQLAPPGGSQPTGSGGQGPIGPRVESPSPWNVGWKIGLAVLGLLGASVVSLARRELQGWADFFTSPNKTLKRWVFGEGSEEVSWLEEAKAALDVGWMWVSENAPTWWQNTKDFGRGFAYEVLNNIALDIPDAWARYKNQSSDNPPAFHWGRAFGAAASLVGGVAEVLIGLGGTVGAGLSIVATFGADAPVAVPVAIASVEMVVHGSAVIVFAAKNTGGRINDAVAYSRSRKSAEPSSPPEASASDPEVVEPLEPNWKRHQKNVTGRNDVAEIKGKIEIDGKVRKVQWDDLQQAGDDWWGVDAKHIDFSRPWYKSKTRQGWALRRWTGQVKRQQAWAEAHGLKGVKWVFSQKPPEWVMKWANARKVVIEVKPLP